MDSPQLSSFNSEAAAGFEESQTYLNHPMMPNKVKSKDAPKIPAEQWKDESRLEEYSEIMKQPMVFDETQSDGNSNEFWEDLARPQDSFQVKLRQMQAASLLGAQPEEAKGKKGGLSAMQKYELDKQVQQLKGKLSNQQKQHEIELGSLKRLANENQKQMLDDTVKKINRQFQKEVSGIVANFRGLQQELAAKERELRTYRETMQKTEYQSVLKNALQGSNVLLQDRQGAFLARQNFKGAKSAPKLELPQEEAEKEPLSKKQEEELKTKAHRRRNFLHAQIQEVLQMDEAQQLLEGFSATVHQSAFGIYSDFTLLTLEDRYQVVMSCFMKFAHQKMREQRRTIDQLTSENLSLHDTNFILSSQQNETADKLKKLYDNKKSGDFDFQQQLQARDQQLQELKENNISEIEKITKNYERQIKLLEGELKCNDIIKQQLDKTNEKLQVELQELKKVIKIPRLHFKYLEKLEYSEIVEQLREIERSYSQQAQQSTTLKSAQKLKKKQMRQASSEIGTKINPDILSSTQHLRENQTGRELMQEFQNAHISSKEQQKRNSISSRADQGIMSPQSTTSVRPGTNQALRKVFYTKTPRSQAPFNLTQERKTSAAGSKQADSQVLSGSFAQRQSVKVQKKLPVLSNTVMDRVEEKGTLDEKSQLRIRTRSKQPKPLFKNQDLSKEFFTQEQHKQQHNAYYKNQARNRVRAYQSQADALKQSHFLFSPSGTSLEQMVEGKNHEDLAERQVKTIMQKVPKELQSLRQNSAGPEDQVLVEDHLH